MQLTFPTDPGLAFGSLMLMIVIAAILQEDLTCIAAGLCLASGELPLWPTLLACIAGIWLGDMGWFLVGRILGRLVFAQWPLFRDNSERRLRRGQAYFRQYGMLAIFLSRFLPGIRTPIQLTAGFLTRRFAATAGVFAAAAAIYTPLVVFGAYLAGGTFDFAAHYKSYGALAMVAAVAAVWGALVVGRGLLRLGYSSIRMRTTAAA